MKQINFGEMIDIEYIKKNIREGWILNPNEKIVNGIIRGLNRCKGQCPCQNDSEDKTCPCSNYRADIKCCCSLYIRE